MSRIAQTFEKLRGRRAALITFITAGDPDPSATVDLMHELVAGGADIIELGVPFSDPMADGPVIQRASERALARGVKPSDVLDMVREFRRRDNDTPVVLMGYLNLIEACGYQRWVDAAAEAGVDGEIVVDLPPEEADDLKARMAGRELDLIFLLAPTTAPERIELICDAARGFIYYVSLTGVTGAGSLDYRSVESHINEIKSRARLPVGVGFGIKDAASAAAIGRFADAVIVGSALVERIHQAAESGDDAGRAARELVAELAGAVAAARNPEGESA
ncbi:MAG TPA: tryptophan synthase subunit alpha [Arenicellales bacterium]|nr:tryptophan synthase subunit alpha [Arenicellales bacterium]